MKIGVFSCRLPLDNLFPALRIFMSLFGVQFGVLNLSTKIEFFLGVL